MKIALIAPVSHLEFSHVMSDLYMCLHWLYEKNIHYRRFFDQLKANPARYIILDNGANEGYMAKDQNFIDAALGLRADEIIAPDFYQKGSKTIVETNDFLNKYYETNKDRLKFMAVVQGKRLSDLSKCYYTFLNDPRISTIGIGYRNLIPAVEPFFKDTIKTHLKNNIKVDWLRTKMTKKCFKFMLSRLVFMLNIVDPDELKKNGKILHFLGCYNPFELYLLNQVLTVKQLKCIRGCDTAIAFQAAQANVRFEPSYGVTDKPKKLLEFETPLSNEEYDLVKKNLKTLAYWLSDGAKV